MIAILRMLNSHLLISLSQAELPARQQRTYLKMFFKMEAKVPPWSILLYWHHLANIDNFDYNLYCVCVQCQKRETLNVILLCNVNFVID